jgi:hypothetical protein
MVAPKEMILISFLRAAEFHSSGPRCMRITHEQATGIKDRTFDFRPVGNHMWQVYSRRLRWSQIGDFTEIS